MSKNILETANKLFQVGQFLELVAFLDKNLLADINEPELWRMYGIALGTVGRPKAAKRAFVSALKLDSKDTMTHVNLITANLDLGDFPSAFDGIQVIFSDLPEEEKFIVVEALTTEMEKGRLELNTIPITVRAFVEKMITTKKAPQSNPNTQMDFEMDLLAGNIPAAVVYIARNQINLEDELVRHLGLGNLRAAETLLLLGPDLTDPTLKKKIQGFLKKGKYADEMDTLLNRFHFDHSESVENTAFDTVLNDISRAVLEYGSHYRRGLRVDPKQYAGVISVGLGAAEVQSKDIMNLFLEVLEVIPWEAHEELFSLYDPWKKSKGSDNKMILVTETNTSFAKRATTDFDIDYDTDTDFLSWNIWKTIHIEIHESDSYLRRLGEISHFGFQKILGALPFSGSILDGHDLTFPASRIYDNMKRLVSEFASKRNISADSR